MVEEVHVIHSIDKVNFTYNVAKLHTITAQLRKRENFEHGGKIALIFMYENQLKL